MTPEILYTLILISQASGNPFTYPPTMATLPGFETLQDCTAAGEIFRNHRDRTTFSCLPISQTRSKTR